MMPKAEGQAHTEEGVCDKNEENGQVGMHWTDGSGSLKTTLEDMDLILKAKPTLDTSSARNTTHSRSQCLLHKIPPFPLNTRLRNLRSIKVASLFHSLTDARKYFNQADEQGKF